MIWTPTEGQAGNTEVEVLVIDGQDGVNRQTFTIEVGLDAINHPPVITSTAKYFAATGVPYRYQIEAIDADNDALIYQLITAPNGITLDANTGELRWENPTFGTHQIVVGVNDGSLGAAQGFTLTVQNDLPPVFNPNEPPTVAIPNRLFSYDIQATDPNGTTLTYRLDDASTALGMSVDELGRLRWTPTVENVGTHAITIEAMDELGTTATQTFNLQVSSDTISPVVKVLPSGVFIVEGNFEVPLGNKITFFTNATDNIGVQGVQLFLDEVPVTLTANGVATYTPSKLGTLTAKAVALDAAGNLGESSIEIRVYDPNDLNPPIVELSPTLGEEPLTNFTDIIGTVTDDNLTKYVLSIAPASGGEFVEIASGNSQITNGKLGEFDPTLLQNDTYILRLTATDESGNSASTEQMVDVAGELKLGNFRLSFTDLEVPVAGIPINLTRTYDTLNAKSQDDFGYGWRLEFRDTDLRTNVGEDELYEQTGIPSVGFEEGTRVYVTLPGGKRTGFTFKPVMDPEIIKALRMGAPLPQSMIFYNPAFETDDGEQVTLSAQKTQLLFNQETGQYYHPSGTPYNPENSFFGGIYALTTKEGIEYKIDGTTGDLLTVTDTNGNVLTYSDSGIVSSTGQSVTFERNAAGQIVAAVDPEGNKIQYEYDENGDLVAVTDREENTTRFEYHEERSHYLEEIIDPLGRSGVRSEYDESGRLSKMLDVNGEAVELVYDPDNSTQTVLDVFGNPTTYVYDGRGNVVTEVDAVGLITQRTYDEDNNVLTETVITEESGSDGWTTTRTYDAEGNKLSETDPLGNVSRWTYNNLGRVLTETNPLGNTTSYSYSPSGNLLSKTDPAGQTTEYSYDFRGLTLSVTDAANEVTNYEYDQFGNLIRQIDPLGHEISYTYDRNGNRLSKTQNVTTPNGIRELRTEWTYDRQGRVELLTNPDNYVTQYEYDANGEIVAIVDALLDRTEYVYDDRGLLEEIVYPDATPENTDDNIRTIARYNIGGRKEATIDPEGRITQYKYNASGQAIETIYPDETPSTDIDNPRTQTEYYNSGRVKANIDELGNRTEYRYNPNGQLVEIIYPDDSPNNLLDNPRTTYEYDKAGQQISTTDAEGRTTKFIYDELGRVIETQFPDRNISRTNYDALGNKISFSDRAGKTTEYRYDLLGQLTGFKDANGNWTEYSYDEANRLLWVKDANDNRIDYDYDGVGRHTSTILPEGQVAETIYDPVGNIVGYIDFNNLFTNYQYNPEDNFVPDSSSLPQQPLGSTYTGTGQIAMVTDSRGTTTYEYDSRDRLISRTDPSEPYIAESGATIEYEYDRAGNVTSITTAAGTTQYFYDEQNRLEKVIDSSAGETRYTYDLVGNLIATELPNGAQETREYNEANQLESLETVRTNDSGEEEVISSFHYTLDAAGNRQSIRDKNGGRVEYEYDNLYRVTKETILNESGAVDRTIAYTYDSVGNRLTRDDSLEGLTTYTYDDNGRLWVEELKKDNVVIATLEYDYDDNGNVISRVKNGSEETLYFWDEKNHLVRVETPTGNTISYSYDSDGIRLSTDIDGQITTYLVDKNRDYAQVIEEHIDDELAVRYTYGLDSIAQQRSDRTSFYHVDGLGSTRALTDIDGNLTDTYSYDAYGNLLHSTGNTTNNYLYTGEQYDPNLDSYYLRARYYDPGLGRFNSPDPFGGLMTEPLSIAKYPYAHGNPVNAIDPSGLFPELTMGGLSNTLAVAGILAAMYWPTVNLLGFVVESEPLPPLGGFDETPVPVPNHTGHPRTEPLSPLGGFGEGEDDIGELPANPPFPNWQMGLRELLENYIFSSIINPDDFYLDEIAKEIGEFASQENRRTIGVARGVDAQGNERHLVASSFGYIEPRNKARIESMEPSAQTNRTVKLEVMKNGERGSIGGHAEERLMDWADEEEIQLKAIGVSHPDGICTYYCWPKMQLRGIRRASPLNYEWRPGPNSRRQ